MRRLSHIVLILVVALLMLSTPLSVSAQVSTPRFTLSPASLSLITGQTATVVVGVQLPLTSKITGVDASLTSYDPAFITVTPTAFPASGNIFPSNNATSIFPNAIKFSSSVVQAGTFFSSTITGTNAYAQFTVNALKVGTTTIRFSCTAGATNDSNIVAYGTGADVIDCAVLPNVVVTVTAPTPTPTPLPTPTPTPVIPVCLTISSDVASPVYGQSVRFTCGQVAGATSYAFRYRLQGTADVGVITPLAAGSNISQPFTYTKAGTYDFECQACIGASCSPYTAW